MKHINSNKVLSRATRTRQLLAGVLILAVSATATAAPKATAPYKISTFATSPAGTSQPDSIASWHGDVIVGLQNHVAKDGSDGKTSTLVEFSKSGKVKRTFTVPGHNDGLRVVGDDDLWALQNEDANPNLVVIELRSGNQKLYHFPTPPHGGGYDDIVVKNGEVYLSASNPTPKNGVNVFPALVRASLSGNMVVLEPVLNGNADALNIQTGAKASLNLVDPDSMTLDPRGNILLDSQADSELVFIQHPLTDHQTVGVLKLSSSVTGPGGALITVDDTAFAPSANASLLVTDVNADTIYRIQSAAFGFEPGTAYSASDTLGLVGTLNFDTGLVTPIVTGFGSARGLLFVAPEGNDDHDE
jgi:hypothetical protein